MFICFATPKEIPSPYSRSSRTPLFFCIHVEKIGCIKDRSGTHSFKDSPENKWLANLRKKLDFGMETCYYSSAVLKGMYWVVATR